MKINSDRRKYNPDGNNSYNSPHEKPPRYDLRRKHKIQDDPLDKLDKKEDEDMKLSADFEVAKKLARKKIKTAGEVKHIRDEAGFNASRENLENFKFNDKGQKAIAKTYKHLAKAFANLIQASNTFNKMKSSQISPDGKLGGHGFITPLKSIRSSLSNTTNILSELIDSFYDEINSPYWKKQTYEDNPEILAIISEADKIIDEAEEKELPELDNNQQK